MFPFASRVRIGGHRVPLALALLLLIGVLLLVAGASGAQAATLEKGSLPFAPGEVLTYRMKVGMLGTVGRGTMQVKGPQRLRGEEVYALGFDLKGRVGPSRIEDRTRSWVRTGSLVSMRYEKNENSPLAKVSEAVDVYGAERRWESAGTTGSTATERPLDELSFLYFIRTLPLAAGDQYAFDRHFDADRNPVRIRVLERTEVRTPAGTFRTVVVEMRVRDPHRTGGEARLRLFLTDDARRLPVRIESPLPVGTMVLELESHTGCVRP